MSYKTSIQWTDRTWPVTTGCEDESPGCLNCYAKALSYRMGLNPNPKIAAAYGGTVEKRAGVLRWTGLLKPQPDRLDWPLKWMKPARIFVGNMSDLFHEDVPFDFIDQVFHVMESCPQHTFQVLTKRAERMEKFVGTLCRSQVPLPNIWLGVSVEDQKRADERIPHLLATPAAVRFLSVEPMLGPVDLESYLEGAWSADADPSGPGVTCPGIDWGICGGESGHSARPFDLVWARDLRDQCKAAGVPFFMKQCGSNPFVSRHRLDPILRKIQLKDSHGGDPDEWPEDLRIREFPDRSGVSLAQA